MKLQRILFSFLLFHLNTSPRGSRCSFSESEWSLTRTPFSHLVFSPCSFFSTPSLSACFSQSLHWICRWRSKTYCILRRIVVSAGTFVAGDPYELVQAFPLACFSALTCLTELSPQQVMKFSRCLLMKRNLNQMCWGKETSKICRAAGPEKFWLRINQRWERSSESCLCLLKHLVILIKQTVQQQFAI